MENIREKKEKSLKPKKKCTHSALIGSPGRWTGNKIIFKGGLGLVFAPQIHIIIVNSSYCPFRFSYRNESALLFG